MVYLWTTSHYQSEKSYPSRVTSHFESSLKFCAYCGRFVLFNEACEVDSRAQLFFRRYHRFWEKRILYVLNCVIVLGFENTPFQTSPLHSRLRCLRDSPTSLWNSCFYILPCHASCSHACKFEKSRWITRFKLCQTFTLHLCYCLLGNWILISFWHGTTLTKKSNY